MLHWIFNQFSLCFCLAFSRLRSILKPAEFFNNHCLCSPHWVQKKNNFFTALILIFLLWGLITGAYFLFKYSLLDHKVHCSLAKVLPHEDRSELPLTRNFTGPTFKMKQGCYFNPFYIFSLQPCYSEEKACHLRHVLLAHLSKCDNCSLFSNSPIKLWSLFLKVAALCPSRQNQNKS